MASVFLEQAALLGLYKKHRGINSFATPFFLKNS